MTGTVSKSGQTITYTVTNAVNVPVGTKIRLEFANINNPLNPSSAYQVTVTTRDTSNAIIDGPSQSTAYTIKQIGVNAIADSSITSTKPAESFMKRVTVWDTPARHAVGWDPDGAETQFIISEPSLSGVDTGYVSAFVNFSIDGLPVPNCLVNFVQTGGFILTCEAAPGSGSFLHYVVANLPAHVIS